MRCEKRKRRWNGEEHLPQNSIDRPNGGQETTRERKESVRRAREDEGRSGGDTVFIGTGTSQLGFGARPENLC